MSNVDFARIMDELDMVVRSHSKRAEQISEENVLGGNREALDAPGTPVSKKEQGKDTVDNRHLEPTKTDERGKSMDYSVTPDNNPLETKTHEGAIDSLSEKSARMGDMVLRDLMRMLKSAEDESEEEEYAEEASEEAAEEASDMTEEELAEKILENTPISEEDVMEIKEAGLRTYSQAFNYIFHKRAAQHAYVAEMQKQAQLSNIEKYAEYRAGETLAELEDSGIFQKQAENVAGQIVAELEKAGHIYRADVMHDEGYNLGLQVREMVKKAYEMGMQDGGKMVKEASMNTTESVIHNILKRNMGKQAMSALGGGSVNF